MNFFFSASRLFFFFFFRPDPFPFLSLFIYLFFCNLGWTVQYKGIQKKKKSPIKNVENWTWDEVDNKL